MINLIDTQSCCGAAEICGAQDFGTYSTDGFFRDVNVLADDDITGYSIILFSDRQQVKRHIGGQALANWIKKNQYGRIVCTPWVMNSNSGNKIRFWSWCPNKRFGSYFKKVRQ